MSALVSPPTMDTGPYILYISWPLLVVSAVFLILRLYLKFTGQRGLWWDDHVLVASWMMMLVFVAILTHSVREGLGQHINNLSTHAATRLQFLVYLASIFSLLAVAWSKTSFALTLLRLTEGSLITVIWVIITSLNIALVADAILPFIRCKPVERNWDTSVTQGECWSAGILLSYGMFTAAFSGVMNILLVLVPWSVVTKTQMNGMEKFRVAICTSLGLLAGVAAFIRCSKISLLAKHDFTFQAGQIAIWTLVEIAITIIAASIPFPRVLYRDIRPSHRRRTYIMSTFDGTFSTSSIKSGFSRTATITSVNGGKGKKPKVFCPEAVEFGLDASDSDGKIVQVQTITVDYDVSDLQASRMGTGPTLGQTVGFDLDKTPPKAKLSQP